MTRSALGANPFSPQRGDRKLAGGKRVCERNHRFADPDSPRREGSPDLLLSGRNAFPKQLRIDRFHAINLRVNNGMLNRLFSFPLLVCLLSACATGPQRHSFTDTAALVLGKTTPEECRVLFGDPKSTHADTGGEGRTETYLYIRTSNRGSRTFARALSVEFKDGALNGYFSSSSFPADRSTFSSANLAKIKWAASTKDEVLNLLGKPAGTSRCPTTLWIGSKCKRTGREIWVYEDLHPVPLLGPPLIKNAFTGSVVLLVFDEHNLVTDMTSSEFGEF
jgi:hypothetical protein